MSDLVVCIGNGANGSGCGEVLGSSGGVCSRCGGMLLSRLALKAADELAAMSMGVSDIEDKTKFEMIKAADEFVASFIGRFRGGNMKGSESMLWGVIDAIDQCEFEHEFFSDYPDAQNLTHRYLEDTKKIVVEHADVPGQMFFTWDGDVVSDMDSFRIDNLHEECRRLRDERNSAQRRVCELSLQCGRIYRRIGRENVEVTTPEGVAEMMGWECYDEEGGGDDV